MQGRLAPFVAFGGGANGSGGSGLHTEKKILYFMAAGCVGVFVAGHRYVWNAERMGHHSDLFLALVNPRPTRNLLSLLFCCRLGLFNKYAHELLRVLRDPAAPGTFW